MMKPTQRPCFRARGPEEIISDALGLAVRPRTGSVAVSQCSRLALRFSTILTDSKPKADDLRDVITLKFHAWLWALAPRLWRKFKTPELITFKKRLRALVDISEDIDALLAGLPCHRTMVGLPSGYPSNVVILNRGEFYVFGYVTLKQIVFVHLEATSESILKDPRMAIKISRLWKRLSAVEAVA